MPKKKPMPPTDESFGVRLARLRRQAGFTQQSLGEQIGLSQRMVAYYERQTSHAPDYLLATLADLLGVSLDELLGVKTSKPSTPQKTSNQRLWRRFRQIEKLPPRDRRQLLALVDAMLERHRLLQKAG